MLFPMSDINIRNLFKSCISPSNTNAKKMKIKNCKKEINFIIRERAYLSASVTIEATLSLFIFLIVVCSVIGLMSVINSELSMEKKINNISLETSKGLFFVDYKKYVKDDYKKYVEKGYLSTRTLSGLYIDGDSMVKLVSPLDSQMINDNVDVRVTYQIKIPFSSQRWWVTQRAKTKDWTGVDISKKQEVVYITKYGRVYHKSKECSHLWVTISETKAGLARSGANEYGKHYKKCQYCGRGIKSEFSTVFITPDGDSMHSDLSCGGITRRIIEINIEEVGDKKPCSECGG